MQEELKELDNNDDDDDNFDGDNLLRPHSNNKLIEEE
jgi:hypothetical protein